MTVPIVRGLRDIADRYEGFIFDVWGVLYDGGTEAFPGVADCLGELQRRGKRILVLSNAPRRRFLVEERLIKIGIPPTLYDHLLTSGEDAHRHLETRPDDWYRSLGRRYMNTGATRYGDVGHGLAYALVESVDEADFVLNTGPDRQSGTVEEYESLMDSAVRRRLPMICANPDLEVVMDGELTVCAGGLAKRYEELGGSVRYHGKPHASIYLQCLELLGIDDPRRVLGVGDGLKTDIRGARQAGMESLLIVAGLPAGEMGIDPGAEPESGPLDDLCRRYGELPTAALATLRW
jgi:HAD superfamily hydrolase (TIGR01459 family)